MITMDPKAMSFIPGALSHCPVSRLEYINKVLLTLSTPGGVPSHTFHIKFRADHGMTWRPEWAGIRKLEDLLQVGVARWAENGQLIYGTEEVVLQRIYTRQKPPQPMCNFNNGQLTIIPFLFYDFEDYELSDAAKTHLQTLELQGMHVMVKRMGVEEEAQDTYCEHPWTLEVSPWFELEISVNFFTNRQFSQYSQPTTLNVTKFSVQFQNWSEEELWFDHYPNYHEALDATQKENSLEYKKEIERFIKFKDWMRIIRKNKRISKRYKNSKNYINRCHVVRIASAKRNDVVESLQSTSLSKFEEKILAKIADYSTSVVAIHALIITKSKTRLALFEGLTSTVRKIIDIAPNNTEEEEEDDK